jgi:hypothetical protein
MQSASNPPRDKGAQSWPPDDLVMSLFQAALAHAVEPPVSNKSPAVMLMDAWWQNAGEMGRPHLSPMNSNLRALGEGGGRNWPSVVNEIIDRLLEAVHPDSRDSGKIQTLDQTCQHKEDQDWAEGDVTRKPGEGESCGIGCRAKWVAASEGVW